ELRVIQQHLELELASELADRGEFWKKESSDNHHKGLIKDAVEFHLLHASSFTSAHTEGDFRNRGELALLRDDLTRINQVLSINNPRIQDFEAQKVKNERIVAKCKELLSKLE
ncbi:15502_t:CDS:2, partial [Funneliformis geosporum]